MAGLVFIFFFRKNQPWDEAFLKGKGAAGEAEALLVKHSGGGKKKKKKNAAELFGNSSTHLGV